ncbi:MAG: ShlB/FhaC/HecB family hemolysin secretion/activation protein [Phycisphaerales bacterium]
MTQIGRRSGKAAVWALVAVAGMAAAVGGAMATATGMFHQEAAVAQPEVDGQRRVVTEFSLRYARENARHPDLAAVLAGSVTLGRLGDGYTAPRDGVESERVPLAEVGRLGGLYDAALPVISQAVVERLRGLGLPTAYVTPDPAQVHLEDGLVVDTRNGSTALAYVITTAKVTQVRTQALGERVPADQTLNHPLHARIRYGSPVRAGEGTDLLDSGPIDDYVARLNRHAGRRVDVAVAATGEEPGAVTLDYLVTENKPWLIYAQAKRDGSRATDEWRYRFGFIHNQLTNDDDVLSLEYQTSFDNVDSFTASYERPIGRSERWRARVYGSWYEYTSADVGLPNATFEGSGWSVGAEAIWNFYQHHDLFVDAVGGVRLEHISVDNNLALVSGDDEFVLGYVGARLEQRREAFSTFAGATLEFSLDGASDAAQQALGRTDADSMWVVLKGDVSHSFYLEPLMDRSLSERTGFAHEIALRAAGQYAFGSRLVPNYQDVVGGLYTVRGYPEAIVAGDSSFVASAEYRLHVPALLSAREEAGTAFGRPFRWRPQYAYGPTDWDLIARAFVDVGRTVNSDRESFEVDQTLVGAGVGLELSITRRFNVRADVGWALEGLDNADGSPLVERGDVQLHFVGTVLY